MKPVRARRGQLRGRKKSFIADQRGVVALEMPIVIIVLIFSLLLPLADVAIAGFKFISAYQALRDMGQRTQYSTPDATDPTSISTWQSSLPTTVDGYTVSATIKCGDVGTAPPCAGTTFPKYYSFQTSFSLSPMVLGSVLCSTCTVNYLQRFQ
jgi:Flp pilus assembly protein TadG